MVLKTLEYYTQLSSTISAVAQKKWEEEITSAERRRLEVPRAMDIIGTQHVHVEAGSASDSNSLTGVGSRWLDLALSIEERQYVFLLCVLNYFHLRILNRIDVRDRLKRLQKDPREECRLEVEMLRQALTTDLVSLQSIQPTFHHTELLETYDVEDPQAESFDDLGDEFGEAIPSGPDEASEIERVAVPPELRALHLPSSYKKNDQHPLLQAELTLRIKQATQYLAAVREAVAEKSFQYSHIMRSAPSKALRTRSQAVIDKISDRISHYSRVYSRARLAMVRLGANERTLGTFQLLSKDDVKASTAVLKPNIPGSSSIRLSWIWETGGKTSGSAPETMQECTP